MRLLIQDGTLVTFGSPCRVLEGQALLIEGDRIARIAPEEEIPGPFDRVLDARGKLVLPGLVNAHMHFYSTLVRGLGKAAPSANFQEVLENLWWRLDRKLSLDDVEMSAKIILVDAIRKGTTTLVDHHASPGAVRGSLGRIARAVKESGLRSCLCYEVSDRDGAAVTDEGLEENAAFARELRRRHGPAAEGPLRPPRGLHALGRDARSGVADGTRPRDRLPRPRRRGGVRRRGEPRGIREDARPAARRARDPPARGASPPTPSIATTPTRTSSPRAAPGSSTNPQSNLNNAVGIADVVGLVRRGVPVGLGTDAMTVGMLEELRVGLWAQHFGQENPSCGFMELTSALVVAEPGDRLAPLGIPGRHPRRRVPRPT